MSDPLDDLMDHVHAAEHPLPPGEAVWINAFLDVTDGIRFTVLAEAGVAGGDVVRLRHFLGLLMAAKVRL